MKWFLFSTVLTVVLLTTKTVSGFDSPTELQGNNYLAIEEDVALTMHDYPVNKLRAVSDVFDGETCRNNLIPFVYNLSAPYPDNKIVFTEPIMVLTGDSFNLAYMLNSTEKCMVANISFSSYNPKATGVYFTDDPSMQYVEMKSDVFVNVTVTGKLIGYSAVKVTVYDPLSPGTVIYSDCGGILSTCRFIAVAYFVQTTADHVYEIMTYIMYVICQIDVGLRVTWDIVKLHAKHPFPILVGLGCHYLLMPLLAFAISKIIDIGSPELAMGYFFAGIVAGGGLSNLHSNVLGGDFHFSCLMTYISQPLMLVFTPMWLAIFEPLIVPSNVQIVIPYSDICIITAEFLIPAIAGFLIRHFSPKLGYFLRGYVTLPLVAVIFLYYCTYGLYTYQWMFQLFTPVVVICGCMFPYFGFALSWLVAMAFRLPKPQVIAIMMETAFQQVVIALSIIQYSISDPIISTLSLVGPYSILIFAQVPVVAIEIALICKRRCLPRFLNRNNGEHDRLVEDDSYKEDFAESEFTESQFMSESNLDWSSGYTTSDETRNFFERQRDYFGKNLVKK